MKEVFMKELLGDGTTSLKERGIKVCYGFPGYIQINYKGRAYVFPESELPQEIRNSLS